MESAESDHEFFEEGLVKIFRDFGAQSVARFMVSNSRSGCGPSFDQSRIYMD